MNVQPTLELRRLIAVSFHIPKRTRDLWFNKAQINFDSFLVLSTLWPKKKKIHSSWTSFDLIQ